MAQNQLTITGKVTSDKGNALPFVKLVLNDDNGSLATTYTDNAGNFSFSLSSPASDNITEGKVVPTYTVYMGQQLLLQQALEYKDSQVVNLQVSDSAYQAAISSQGKQANNIQGTAEARQQATSESSSSDFDNLVADITNVRVQKASTFQSLTQEREGLKIAQYGLAYAQANALDTSSFVNEINTHTQNVNTLTTQLNQQADDENNYLHQIFTLYPSQQSVVENLNDRIPILFFPVRIETSFQTVSNNAQLWVRIYPDDVAVETHEQQLTQDEIDQGQQYWQTVNAAGSDQVAKNQAWDLLCRSYSAERAAWVAIQTNPANNITLVPKADTWTQQPVTRILPDAFVVLCYTSNDYTTPAYSAQTLPIPDEVAMGFDPNQNETFDQSNGELTANDPSVDWLIHFDAAINIGLGVKIPIDNSITEFTRIVVLGVKTTLAEDVSQQRLQNLIESHHYTDGFSLLQQGTSTNNTDSGYSGYSSVDFSNTTTYATEEEGDLFTPVTTNEFKTDGQVLCEALGIDYDYLYHIYHSDGYDIRNSMFMNNVLFATSVGYYLNDMVSPLVSSSTVNQLRQFFADYVRSRGVLPSIRAGLQPYGILPATAYSKMDWSSDPMAGLYSNVHHVTNIFDGHYAQLVSSIPNAGGSFGLAANKQGLKANTSVPDTASQRLLDIITQTAVSQDVVQRLGVGSGYIWNNLAYADRDGKLTQEWLNNQLRSMNFVKTDSGLPLDPLPKISQVNFMQQQSTVKLPMVADASIAKNSTLPQVGRSGMNYLQLLSKASFAEIRDENYENYQITADDIPQTLLYQYARQSLMLEYFDAACQLLGIPDELRMEPELVNIVNAGSPPSSPPQKMAAMASPPSGQTNRITDPTGQSPFALYAGDSRWSIMTTPYNGYHTITDFIDSPEGAKMPQVAAVIQTRSSLAGLSAVTVGHLNLHASEVLDAASFRLDAWRLALVNQRLNDLRGIQDGSATRNQGIFLGAYGWIENVKKDNKTTVQPPTGNFTGTIYTMADNEGYIHAPSINQAATAAVLRNGYVTRADASNNSVLSVNISSERTRSVLSLLEGLRNGQPIGQLLGADFEQRLSDDYTYGSGEYIDQYITVFRLAFPLSSTLVAYDVAQQEVTSVQAANVLDGTKIIDAYKTAGYNLDTLFSNYPDTLGTQTPPPVNGDMWNAITYELGWLTNIMDALGDVTTAEGVFQLVQGNQVRSSAVTDAISKGYNIPEIQLIDTPKTGISVNQRLNLHLEVSIVAAPGWESIAISPRAHAEPYLNRWIGQLLGDPANIKCEYYTSSNATMRSLSLTALQIQPLDLVYIVNDELVSDTSELSLRIKKYIRENNGLTVYDTDTIFIDYSQGGSISAGTFSFAEVLPLLKYFRSLVTSCRPLTTLDYVAAADSADAINIYDDTQEFWNRVNNAANQLQNAHDNLDTANSTFTDATQNTTIRNLLFELSPFGFDQTVYEYSGKSADDYSTLKAYANAVTNAAKNRLTQFSHLSLSAQPATDTFINSCLEGMQIIFGQSFKALPLFKVRAQECGLFYNELTNAAGYNTLLADHSELFIMDEWVSGIGKVRKNMATYELLSLTASAINLDAFNTDRTLIPLQTPFDTTGGYERWLGAKVNDTTNSLRDGRTALGISIPGTASDFATAFNTGQGNPSNNLVGIQVDEWIDIIPNRSETTGVAFQYNQPLAKPPQCLLLGLTPVITGKWQWGDIVDMVNETLDLAKKRAVTYETLSGTSLGQILPAFMAPLTRLNTTIGLTAQ